MGEDRDPEVPATAVRFIAEAQDQHQFDLGMFFNSSPNAYMVLDRDLILVAANDAYLEATGVERREDILGLNLFEAFPGNTDDPNDIGVRQVRASFQRVLQTGKADHLAVVPYTIAVNTSAGPQNVERYWSATHTPLFDEDGDVRFILQHTVDVTELQETKRALKLAEEALDRSFPREQIEQGVFRRAQLVQEAKTSLEVEWQRLRQWFEQAPGFVAILDGKDHVFSLVNEAYSQLIGHREVAGKPVRDALPELEGQGFFDLLDSVYSSGEPFVGRASPVRLQRTPNADLEEVYVDFLYQPIFDPEGLVTGIFVQGHDVTDQIRAREELREMNSTLEQRVRQRTLELEARNRELQEFAYVASHDLQEPLRKIHSFADIISTDYEDLLDDDGRTYLGRIRHAAQRMSTLISDLLAFSRVQTSGESMAPVDLNYLIEEVLIDLEESVREAGAQVEVGNLPRLEVDPMQMRQLFQNLISNAIKYRRKDLHPKICIRVSLKEDGDIDTTTIEVQDNGIGFDPKYIDRIFSPFQRLHGKEVYGGTGMGLAICRRIVQRHHGRITAKSEPGKGSTFIVELPVRRASY